MLIPEIFKPVSGLPDITENIWGRDALVKSDFIHREDGGFPDLSDVKIVLIGVPEYRGAADGRRFLVGTQQIREMFYRLQKHASPVKVGDLGDLIPGETLNDTYAALENVVFELLEQHIVPVIIGGTQDLSIAHYNTYKRMEKVINVTSIDARFDLGLPDDPSNNQTWLGKIIMQQPNYLFNFSNIGYQTYFAGSSGISLMERLFFDTYRVGQVRADITEMEPVIRSADMLSFDLSAIRQGDAPGTSQPSPNGFSGEEACQAMFYAGMNDRLSGIGIYEYDAHADRNNQTAHLTAQMIWYFIEGFSNRKNDIPHPGHEGFLTYRVSLDKSEIIFLKNQRTGRWWMEVPLSGKNNRYRRHNFLPCSMKDYQQACNNEMPDRYWQALQKIT